jgi:hypothetical protein
VETLHKEKRSADGKVAHLKREAKATAETLKVVGVSWYSKTKWVVTADETASFNFKHHVHDLLICPKSALSGSSS